MTPLTDDPAVVRDVAKTLECWITPLALDGSDVTAANRAITTIQPYFDRLISDAVDAARRDEREACASMVKDTSDEWAVVATDADRFNRGERLIAKSAALELAELETAIRARWTTP